LFLFWGKSGGGRKTESCAHRQCICTPPLFVVPLLHFRTGKRNVYGVTKYNNQQPMFFHFFGIISPRRAGDYGAPGIEKD
jgi:hypothetical protein